MKKTKVLSLALVFALTAVALFASPFGAGVTAGGALSFISTDNPGDGSPRYGLTGGIYGTYSLYAGEDTMDLSVRPEVLFTMKGYRSDVSGTTYKFNTNYIEVPVLAKAAFSLDLPVVPYLLVGPSTGILVTANRIIGEGDPVDVKDDYKSLDFGIVFGAGVETEIGLDVDVRFNLGLLDIEDGAMSGAYYIKNRTISVMASYALL